MNRLYLFSNCEVYEGEDGDCDYEARHPQDQECQQHHRTQLLAIHLREAWSIGVEYILFS